MRNAQVFAIVVLFFLFFPVAVPAQGGQKGLRKSSCAPLDRISFEGLNLTEEQRNSIEKIERTYEDAIAPLQSKLMGKRFEFESVFRDSQADERTIREKATEILGLQGQCQQIMVDYQIKIREVLTPEQLKGLRSPMGSCSPGVRGGKP